jgi:hypothetical protein
MYIHSGDKREEPPNAGQALTLLRANVLCEGGCLRRAGHGSTCRRGRRTEGARQLEGVGQGAASGGLLVGKAQILDDRSANSDRGGSQEWSGVQCSAVSVV